MTKEYRLSKLKVSRHLLEEGLVIPPNQELLAQLLNSKGEQLEKGRLLIEAEEQLKVLNGWDILSCTLVEHEGNDVVLLFLLQREVAQSATNVQAW